MNVSDLVTTDYAEVSADERVARVVSAFEDSSCRGVVVTDDGRFDGVITRRRLIFSHREPDQKAASVTWPAPRVGPREDVREAAQLMLGGDVRLLPVFDDQQLVGVVTADALLEHVQEYLEAATVGDAVTSDVVTVERGTTLGDALHRFREHNDGHLPVVDGESPVGMLSLVDILNLVVREGATQQGGDLEGFGDHGGEGSSTDFRSYGGRDAREGESERLRDLPIRDVMASPVRTARRSDTLETAVDEMFDADASSLVVVDDGDIDGIVTKTDVLDTLTWETTGHRAVQVYGTEYIRDADYDDIVDLVDELDGMDSDLDLQDARVHISKHQERRRGTPLLYVRVRLSTDRGLITASAEGYGASHALNEVEDVLKRRVRDEKTAGHSKKHPDEEFWQNRFDWTLAE